MEFNSFADLPRPKHDVTAVRDFIERHSEFYIFGTGWRAQRDRRQLAALGKRVLGFIGDNDQESDLHEGRFQRHSFGGFVADKLNLFLDYSLNHHIQPAGSRFCGLPVVRASEVDTSNAKILISAESNPARAIQALRSLGFKGYADFVHVLDFMHFCNSPWAESVGMPFFDYVLEHREQFMRAIDSFDDPESRETYRAVIRYRVLALEIDELTEADQPFSLERYRFAYEHYPENRDLFAPSLPRLVRRLLPRDVARVLRHLLPSRVPKVIQHRAAWYLSFDPFSHMGALQDRPDPVILDCGAFEGETSMAFSRLWPQATIFAFEPGPAAFAKLAALARNVPAIIAVKAGTWNEKTSAFLDGDGEGAAVRPGGGTKIELVSIDGFADEHRLKDVSAIKMNIEGAEIEALEGARRTINRFHPILCVCAEHKPSDLWKVPVHIKTHHPKYTLGFKHTGDHIFGSLVTAV